MTRGSFFGAVSSFSEADDTSVNSLSSEADVADVAAALGRPFRAADFLPGDEAGLARLLPFAGLRSRRVRSEAGIGARGAVGIVCEESIDAKSSTVRASHGAGGTVWDGRPPRRFLVAASSYEGVSLCDALQVRVKTTYRGQVLYAPPCWVSPEVVFLQQTGKMCHRTTCERTITVATFQDADESALGITLRKSACILSKAVIE